MKRIKALVSMKIKKIIDIVNVFLIDIKKLAVLVSIILCISLLISITKMVTVYNAQDNDDIIKFNDSQMGKAVTEYLNDKYITYGEALDVKTLVLKNHSNIYDLEDLKPFKNLEALFVTNCDLQSLNGIQTFENLKVLDCSTNSIEDISQLYYKSLSKLTNLNLEDNNIRDITGLLTYLKNLEMCNVSDCKLSGNIDLGVNKRITTLDLSDNEITGFSGELPKLIEVYLNSNNITNLDFLVKCDNLIVLDVSGNQIESLDSIIDFTKLEELDIRDNLISQYSLLSKLDNLNSIYLDKDVNRQCIDFIIENFKDGDIYTKQYILKNKYNLDTKKE